MKKEPTAPGFSIGRQVPLSVAYENVTDVVFVVRLDENDRFYFAAANSRFYDTTGLSPAQVLGRYVDQVIPPDSHELVFGNYRKALVTRQPVVWEETSSYPSGTKVGEVKVVPVVEQDGSCCSLAGVVRDVTESRQLLATLEGSEERWRLALQGAGAGVWDWSVQENRATYSATWRSILGYAEDEIDDSVQAWESRIHPDDKEAVLAQLRDLFNHRRSAFENEHRLRHKNGHWIWTHSHAMVLYDAAGKLERLIGTMTDITVHKEAEQMIWRQANFDSLTGMSNRTHFSERVRDAIHRAGPAATPFALVLVDLDRFKVVNDSLGHSIGDALLQEAAIRLRAAIPGNAVAARLGGDEFAVMVPGSEHTAQRVAAALTRTLEAPYHFGFQQAHITASTGVARYPEDGQDGETLIKQADQAMYCAKRQGGNRVAAFSPEMQAQSNARQKLIVDLHRALDHEQFHLQYQPIVDLATGKAAKAEALIRWHHPLEGFISPANFIPLAEEVGLIQPITTWALYRALNQWKQLCAHGCYQISVNISSTQFASDVDLVQTVLTALEELDVDPRCLVLELTETVLLELDAAKEAKFRHLREAGIALALDDFGTGFSSLAYINRLQFDFLKIDRVFTQGIGNNPASEALCEAMISMAHKLGMQVVAEGIQNAQQCDVLRQAGCQYGQGFFFSPAVNLEHFPPR